MRMIYIIDDKTSRQKDFGWCKERFEAYSDNKITITPIWSIEELNEKKEAILQDGNIVLYHESFFSTENADKTAIIESFKRRLIENANNLYITYFSYSKSGRYVKEQMCMLPPDILYSNLDVFINKLRAGDLSFRYLAFGENYQIEEILRERLDKINDENVEDDKVSASGNIFFAATSDNTEVEPPFDNIEITSDWDLDLQDKDITDQDLDGLVNDWFLETRYDRIYIPLCFGSSLSDYMGLRLAMHIRLTSTPNQKTPIFLYGVATYEEMKQNYCFDILKTSSVRLIGCDNKSFFASIRSEMPECDLAKEIKFIHLDLPSNIGSHSLANQWGASVLGRAANVEYDIPAEVQEAMKSLYFKNALFQTSLTEGDEVTLSKKAESIESKGRRILLIDDEADRGWAQIIHSLFENAYVDIVKNKIPNFEALPDQYIKRIQEDFYDLYLLDLRLLGEREESIVNTDKFSGMDVLDAIKEINPGNQVIIMTASNKAWNMKKLMKKQANGYYIKEAPELSLPFEFSQENYSSFKIDVEAAFQNVYKRDLWAMRFELISYIADSSIDDELKDELQSQLDVYEQFLLNATNKNNLSLVFLTLFQVFDTIKRYYSKEMLFTSMSIPDNIRDIVNEKGSSRMSDSEFKELINVNKARNNFIHKLNKECGVDHKSVNGLKTLFKVVSDIIHLL